MRTHGALPYSTQATDLAAKCAAPFVPADADAETPAYASCCASDITLEEFKTLCGKMDTADSTATTVEEYFGGTANFRTDLFSSCGTLVTHAESIELIKSLGAIFTPELKTPSVEMVRRCSHGGVYPSIYCPAVMYIGLMELFSSIQRERTGRERSMNVTTSCIYSH